MAQDFAQSFYASAPWRKCRAAYIAKRIGIDGGMCEVCHERPGKIVHHKIWLNEMNINDPGIALNFDNLKFECQECHNLEGMSDDALAAKLPKIAFGPDGEVYGIPETDEHSPPISESDGGGR